MAELKDIDSTFNDFLRAIWMNGLLAEDVQISLPQEAADLLPEGFLIHLERDRYIWLTDFGDIKVRVKK